MLLIDYDAFSVHYHNGFKGYFLAPLCHFVGGLSPSIYFLVQGARGSHESHIHFALCGGQLLHSCVNHNQASCKM